MAWPLAPHTCRWALARAGGAGTALLAVHVARNHTRRRRRGALNAHKPARVRLSVHTRRRLAGPATKRLKPACLGARRRPSRALLRRNGRTVWDTARRARTSKRGMCYVGIGCAHGRGCRSVLSPTAPRRGAVRARPPPRSDPPSTTVHRSARAARSRVRAAERQGRRACSLWMGGRRRRRVCPNPVAQMPLRPRRIRPAARAAHELTQCAAGAPRCEVAVGPCAMRAE
mmetsp:Transcript_22117/g.56812  ORF Transcript_22117/g.56812 Transcript_22117/m.56812 type:complete len:229 (-) Transcript_22117:238-924(-)